MADTPRPYTDAEDTRIVELRSQGLSWESLARAIDRPTGQAVRLRYEKVRSDRALAVAEAKRTAAMRERPCMTCRKDFRSEGKHNRMCTDCRERAGHLSPIALQLEGVQGRGGRGQDRNEYAVLASFNARRVGGRAEV